MAAAFPWICALIVLVLLAFFLSWAVVYAASRRHDRPEQRGFEVVPKDCR